MLALSLQTALNTFMLAVITGIAAAMVAGTVRLIRHLRRVDETVKSMEHGQRHLLRWARRAGRKVDVPFPLDEDAMDYFEVNPEKWQEKDEEERKRGHEFGPG